METVNMSGGKREQERAELHRAIWNIANDLRGSVDGSFGIAYPHRACGQNRSQQSV